ATREASIWSAARAHKQTTHSELPAPTARGMLICSGMRRKSGNHEQIGGSERGGSDRLSGAGPAQRRAVHPYRDDGGRDALVAERRAKERELADADRAAERRDRLKKELAVID